jgi:hypothetical protein
MLAFAMDWHVRPVFQMLAFAMDWHVRLGSHEACLVKAMDVGMIDTVLRAVFL